MAKGFSKGFLLKFLVSIGFSKGFLVHNIAQLDFQIDLWFIKMRNNGIFTPLHYQLDFWKNTWKFAHEVPVRADFTTRTTWWILRHLVVSKTEADLRGSWDSSLSRMADEKISLSQRSERILSQFIVKSASTGTTCGFFIRGRGRLGLDFVWIFHTSVSQIITWRLP